ncbi:hypothetical protein HZH66_009628 [Vespula vulgaris]|uniref:Uncharacterized protein n=2 Tax=Vespula TaxID=7451 RepID=A0A834JM76_VESVU|nr:hypothetical protein HZH66_009628 [Vespula vulgaris]
MRKGFIRVHLYASNITGPSRRLISEIALLLMLVERKNVLWLTTQATSRRFINPSKTGSKDEERKERRAGGEEEEIREPGARRHCRNFGHYNNKEPS